MRKLRLPLHLYGSYLTRSGGGPPIGGINPPPGPGIPVFPPKNPPVAFCNCTQCRYASSNQFMVMTRQIIITIPPDDYTYTAIVPVLSCGLWDGTVQCTSTNEADHPAPVSHVTAFPQDAMGNTGPSAGKVTQWALFCADSTLPTNTEVDGFISCNGGSKQITLNPFTQLIVKLYLFSTPPPPD